MKKIELNCPAGSLPSLKIAVDNGADAVYFGFTSRSNLRMYPGLNFSYEEAKAGIEYAHDRGKRVYITINTFPQQTQLEDCYKAVENAYNLEADAIIVADTGIMRYAKEKYPDLRLHASVLAKTYNAKAVEFYRRFNVKRVTMPCLLTLNEIEAIRKNQPNLELEAFAFGRVIGICYEGCYMNSFIAGWPITTKGSCTPVEHLTEENGYLKLKGVTIGKIDPDEPLPYPAICMGLYKNLATNNTYRIFRDATSLSILPILPKLIRIGINSLKIEGRQRSKVYVAISTKIFREAINLYYSDSKGFQVKDDWRTSLASLAEGGHTVTGYVEKGY